ncbi:MAG TPA: 4-hydroxythreonine-4-phosphate dehydrogenase PdxA, partial [Ignavibacteriaceae bacterium]|nr:4-hydroxythreonine-4-phosphate dehydrogenase PdxA [Ignavibacteriaceae bacterium]
MKKRYIFSCGDINGIGPEIVIKSLNRLSGKKGNQFIFICPGNVFKEISSLIRPSFKVKVVKKVDEIDGEDIILFDTGMFKLTSGKPTKSSGKAAFLSLEIAAELLMRNLADALITAPISKEALNEAGYRYPGHTELLAEWFQTRDFAMMFLSRKLKAALATIHKSLSHVPGLLSKQRLESVSDVILNSLKKDFRIN